MEFSIKIVITQSCLEIYISILNSILNPFCQSNLWWASHKLGNMVGKPNHWFAAYNSQILDFLILSTKKKAWFTLALVVIFVCVKSICFSCIRVSKPFVMAVMQSIINLRMISDRYTYFVSHDIIELSNKITKIELSMFRRYLMDIRNSMFTKLSCIWSFSVYKFKSTIVNMYG